MMSDTKLVRRFFWVILMTIAVMFCAIYIYSVPLIQKEVYEIERNSARLALNNVFQLANKMYSNLEGYREQSLDAHKQRLKAVVELTEAQVINTFNEARKNNLSINQARIHVFENLRNFTYGTDGYIWVADHDATLLSHPDPRFQGFEISQTDNRDQSGIIREVIDAAVNEGEGFYQYKWQRLSEGSAIDKLSYVKNYPQWGFVIGSGLYLDDLEIEVQARKHTAIQEVREALSEIQIAKTGYLYIFDKEGHLLVHPNPNIDQTSATNLINPSSGQPIIDELINVADTGKELHYKWDKPSDPGNYIYDKISLVRSLEGFGWYICSSVYVDELRHSSVILSQRILTIALISILLAITLAVFFINRIVQPIKQLARTAERVRSGDLTARSGIERDDELGMLARTFDTMVHRLRTNIQTLDSTVQERTQELAQLEERQRLILDALPAQIAYLDKNLHYHFVNKGYADLFERGKNSIVGCSIDEVIDPHMMASITPQIEQCLSGKEVAFEYRFDLNGREIITKRLLLPDVSSNGEVIGLLNLSLDITAEKEAERRLTEAQRMSAVGQLAGGLAHDFNNLLSVILGNLLAASDHFDDVEGLQKYLTPAVRASRRGADITARLLAFSRRQALTPTAVQLQSLLQDTVELVTSSLPCNITVTQQVTKDISLFVDPGQLENALVNLALNAKDAMPEGGEIEFHVQRISVTYPLAYDEPVATGDYIEIQVNDTGNGFSEEALAQACEPFYTTKGSGLGSGLGLSMVYGFIKQSRGYIAIINRPDLGASVSLLLPVLPDQTVPDQTPEAIPYDNPDFSHQLLLLAEDNRDVRDVVREQLISLGFTVLEAADADEAEQLITTLPELDGLITDIDMPGRLNGFGLADLMRKRDATSTIVLISGYANNHQTTAQDLQWKILRKPFDRDNLAKAINNAMHTGTTITNPHNHQQ